MFSSNKAKIKRKYNTIQQLKLLQPQTDLKFHICHELLDIGLQLMTLLRNGYSVSSGDNVDNEDSKFILSSFFMIGFNFVSLSVFNIQTNFLLSIRFVIISF